MIQAGVETCDDGNADDRDACTRGCEVVRCGDGITRNDIEPSQVGYEEVTTATRRRRRLLDRLPGGRGNGRLDEEAATTATTSTPTAAPRPGGSLR